MWQWKAAAASPGLARSPDLAALDWNPSWGMTQSRRQEPWLLCAPHTPTHPPLPSHPLCPVLFFHAAPECTHSLTPHGASWALGVDSHLRNLWELKNTHISNCAAHKVQHKPCPPDPHRRSASGGTFFFKCSLIAFPGRTVVYLCLISFLFFLSDSPFCPNFLFFFSKEKMESKGAPN